MQPFYPGFAALQPQEIVAVARSNVGVLITVLLAKHWHLLVRAAHRRAPPRRRMLNVRS
jgi:hypothetical protein